MDFIELDSGTSHEGSPIHAYRCSNKQKKFIYLMAGVHGDEVEGVYVLNEIFEYLKNDESIDLPFIVIPILNIDGLRSATRVNAKGVDLNRNLPAKSWSSDFKESKYNPGSAALSEPESVYLEKLFKKFPPKLIISFHSWKPIVNYNGNCLNIAQFISDRNKYIIADDIGYSTPGSLGDYAPEAYDSPVITFECPVLEGDLSLKDIWEENKSAFIDLLHSDLLDGPYS